MAHLRIGVFTIILISVLNSLNGEHTSAKCDFGDPSSRRDCGWPGISRTQCEEQDCCYDSRTPGVKWCFHGQYTDDDKCEFSNPKDRIDCGWAGITKKQCESRGCCYDGRRPNVKWCFRKALYTKKDTCNFSNPASRIACGWGGITQEECESRNCCFDNRVSNVKWCFGGNYTNSSVCDYTEPEKRRDCGWPKITPAECLSRGCCYDNRFPSYNYCFYDKCPRILDSKSVPIGTVSFFSLSYFEGYSFAENYIPLCHNVPDYFKKNIASVNTNGKCITVYEDEECRGNSQNVSTATPFYCDLSHLQWSHKIMSWKPCDAEVQEVDVADSPVVEQNA